LYTGAAPLGKELVSDLRSVYPSWNICQAYGLTESATVSTSTSRSDIWPGSAGSILPGAEVRIIADDGTDIDAYDTPGEIWFKGPSVVIGYLDNERATSDTFIEDESGRWLKTGDKGEIRICPESGNEHVWIVDRIKELIKVNVGGILFRTKHECLLISYRATKSLPQSWNLIFLAILPWQTVLSFPPLMTPQVRSQRLMS
jgi:long-subunit acyl-CoA synthetase (AMP-forming)